MREWLYYNSVAGSFHTKKLCSRLYSIEIDFYSKNKKIAFWATLPGLKGKISTPSITHWKARSRFYIRHNWTLFAIFYGWDVRNGNLWKSAFFEGGGSLWAQISDGMQCHPPSTVGVKKLEWLPFRVVSKYLLLSQCMRVMDRQTDRIMTAKHSIAACTVKMWTSLHSGSKVPMLVGAWEMATTSKEGSRCANYPLPTRGGSDEK